MAEFADDKELLAEAAEIVLSAARAHIPVDTGETRDSLNFHDFSDRQELWGNRPAKFLITGTKPHVIQARWARSLHWVDRATGEDRFALWVNHPGTQGNDWRTPAIRDAMDGLRAAGLKQAVIVRSNLKRQIVGSWSAGPVDE